MAMEKPAKHFVDSHLFPYFVAALLAAKQAREAKAYTLK
jgi:hypothetical protein